MSSIVFLNSTDVWSWTRPAGTRLTARRRDGSERTSAGPVRRRAQRAGAALESAERRGPAGNRLPQPSAAVSSAPPAMLGREGGF